MQLRVLAVIPGEAEGASMIFAKRQIRSLEEAGIAVRSFFLASRTSPGVLIRERNRLRGEIRGFGPDLVHAQYGTMTAYLCTSAAAVPVVVTFRGSDLNPHPGLPRFKSAFGRLLSQLAAARAAQIICVSEQLKGRLCWGRERAHVIPSGVDTQLFHPRPREEARQELRWRNDERVVLFNAGRDPRIKRLDLAQASVEAARRLGVPLRFEILEGGIPPERIPLYLCAADCLLVTSDWEGSPNIVKEALACALPVVSVDVGDVRERLEGTSASRIVPRDPEAIGSALADIIRQEARVECTSISELSLENTARRVIAVYEAAIRNSKRETRS